MPQCSKNFLCMKYSHVPCENDSLKHFVCLTCYEIFCFFIKSSVASDLVVVNMFIKCFSADCFTHLSTFSDDVRTFSGFCQNTRVSRYVYYNDFKHSLRYKMDTMPCSSQSWSYLLRHFEVHESYCSHFIKSL